MVFIGSRPSLHRQNRRRGRPGARTRKALSNRESIQHDFQEGITVARDCSLWLPSETYPLWACECWREEDNDREDLGDQQSRLFVDEQFRVFGGEVGDDELRQMGILYNNNDVLSDSQSTLKPEAPPEFSIRPARTKQRHSPASRTQFQLPEYLTTSLLSDNPSIAPWLFTQTSHASTPQHQQQHRPSYPSRITIQHPPPITPQSLPASSNHNVVIAVPTRADSFTSNLCFPPLFPVNRDDEDLADATWDFITSSTRSSAPPSEPETWILLE